MKSWRNEETHTYTHTCYAFPTPTGLPDSREGGNEKKLREGKRGNGGVALPQRQEEAKAVVA